MKTYISGIKNLSKHAYQNISEISEVSYVNLDNEEALINALKNCDVFWFRLNHKLSRAILKDSRCKYILSAVTGLDHIDLRACDEFGVKVISLKGEKEFLKEVRATAEHTICLLLSLIRKTKNSFSHVESSNWDRRLFKGTELYKKKIGILGFGRLGKIVAEYATVFGMQVYYYDIDNSCNNENYIRSISLLELVGEVDVLSIHLDYNDSSHNIINKDILSQMKETIQIINTSRGGVVKEFDMIDFLRKNENAGYATDVVYGEPNIKESSIVKYAKENENVIITPHVGGNTYESIYKTEDFIADKFIKHISKI